MSQLKLLKTYFNLAYFTDKLELYFTSIEDGKENYHVVAHDLPNIPFDKACELRLMFGDDPYRVWLDQRLESKPKMVLFNIRSKQDRRSGRWIKNYRERLTSILWKPWISKVPAKKPINR